MKSIMDQGIFLFDNQYHPDVIDRVYQRVLETTWGHCMSIQETMCQHHIYGGPLTDFKCDEALNTKMGFPAGSYTTFIKEKLLTGNQKYILDHFIRNQELLNLREMLQNPRFTYQFIFHIADYTFMNLKCRIVQNGTWLVIPIDTVDGISHAKMQEMMDDYDNPFTPSRWVLEKRPKVSYAYGETTAIKLIDSYNRIYLNQFSEKMQYFKSEEINDWKVCTSEMTSDLNLMRATPAILKFDDTGKPYIEVSQQYADHIKQATFNVHCFLYNESHKAGYTLSPNYIGPTQYLKTSFNEYIATVESQKMKVVAMDVDGGWTTLTGADKQFGTIKDLIAVGFSEDQCWLSIPTASGVGPIWPGNFRVWEYDAETDTLGRMLSTDMYAVFPNLYFFKMKSDCMMLYIEWFRDDETIGTNYDDITEFYREYVGTDFPFKLVNGEAPEVISDFRPLENKYSANDFVKHVLFYSSHEYRVDMISKLLQETGMHYDEIIDCIDSVNAEYTTVTYKMSDMPELYARLKSEGSAAAVCINTSSDNLRPYDLYVDGLHISNTRTYWRNFNQYVTVPANKLTENSVIIVDFYDYTPQVSSSVHVSGDFLTSLIPKEFPIPYISANNLVITKPDGTRFNPLDITFGLYADEYLIQIPETLVDWDELGITINDPRIADRVAVMHPTGNFKSVVFRLILPTVSEDAALKTIDDTQLLTSLGEAIIVKAGNIFVTTEGYDEIDMTKTHKFSKKVRSTDLAIKIAGENPDFERVSVYNANVWRKTSVSDLSVTNEAVIPSFCGADDPTRIVCFINGILRGSDEVDGQIPDKINSDFKITFNNAYTAGSEGEVVYLPFPTDRFDVLSDGDGIINLANSGVMTIGVHDMIFENGYRIPNDSLERVTNQIVKAPKPNTMYTIMRMHRDSNLFGFKDTSDQSFMDILFQQSPGFKQAMLQ